MNCMNTELPTRAPNQDAGPLIAAQFPANRVAEISHCDDEIVGRAKAQIAARDAERRSMIADAAHYRAQRAWLRSGARIRRLADRGDRECPCLVAPEILYGGICRVGGHAMTVGRYCKRAVISISANVKVAAAARRMLDEHVRFLVVYEEADDMRRPVGVLTDRDIVLQMAVREAISNAVTVADVMTRQPMVANEEDDVCELMQAMRLSGIHRVPVVDARGALSGILALDDVITELRCDVSGSIKNEQSRQWHARGRSLVACPLP